MLLLYDVQHVGAGDAVELWFHFSDCAAVVCDSHVVVAYFDGAAAVSAFGWEPFFDVSDICFFNHGVGFGHYFTLKKWGVVN